MIEIVCKISKTQIENYEELKKYIYDEALAYLSTHLALEIISARDRLDKDNILTITIEPCLTREHAQVDPALAGQNGA